MRRLSERIAYCAHCRDVVPVVEVLSWTGDPLLAFVEHGHGVGAEVPEDLALPDTPENRAALLARWAHATPCRNCEREPAHPRSTRGLCTGCRGIMERSAAGGRRR